MRQRLSYLSEFVKEFVGNPGVIGSVSPSSQFLAHAMLAGIPQDLKHATVVEYGPGSGAVTRHIMEKVHPNNKLIAFEVNPYFQELIRTKYPKIDLRPVSAAEINQELSSFLAVDYIISSIPFTFLPEAICRQILIESFAALRPGGCFSTFLYLQSFLFRKNQRFVQMAQQIFGPASSRVVIRNMPPAVVLHFNKPDAITS